MLGEPRKLIHLPLTVNSMVQSFADTPVLDSSDFGNIEPENLGPYIFCTLYVPGMFY